MTIAHVSFRCWTSLLACGLAVVLLFGPAGSTTARGAGDSFEIVPADAVGMDAATLDRIAPKMQEFVAAGTVSGVVTLVAKDGKIVQLKAVGEADLDTHRPMKTDSVFAIASMTKPITATAVMILKDEGKLSLDDKISKYIPEFKEAALASGPPQREITLRDLLTHTSGMAGEQRNEGTIAETAAKMAKRPLAFEPGSKWQYSPAITICGRAVEVASGQPFEEFLAARVFKPLKMVDTTFFPTAAHGERLARLYQRPKDSDGLAPASHWLVDLSAARTANPSGGLFSTATDMARFYQMILNGGTLEGARILSADSVAEMTRLHTGEMQAGFAPGEGWGLGWAVVREPQGVSAVLSRGSFGHGGAFGTQGWVDPQKKMVFVLLVQRSNLSGAGVAELRSALQGLAIEAVKK